MMLGKFCDDVLIQALAYDQALVFADHGTMAVSCLQAHPISQSSDKKSTFLTSDLC